LVKLAYGEGRMDGKRSIAGGGHAISFECPDDGKYILRYVELFGSRYGMQDPPAEDFFLHVLDEDMKVICTAPIPYSTFERGAEKWIAIPAGDIIVPRKFSVSFDFNPHQTKGVYVGFEKSGKGNHSKVGKPGTQFTPFDDGSDWMIRAYLAKKAVGQ
jgi:hypothetical protein